MRYFLPIFCVLIVLPFSASAQNKFYNYANICPKNWESQACLSTVSQIVYDMVTLYEKGLNNISRPNHIPALKEKCAAATAAANGEFPAYAMQSAYTECANNLYELSEQTSLKPQAESYQALIGAVLCLSKDPSCSGIESQLIRKRQQ
jgi:hypothetical protein